MAICSGDSVTLQWSTGSYADEASFTLFNGDGTQIGTSYYGDDYSTGDVIVTFMPVCPSCFAPTNLTFSDITANTATIAWTAGNTETAWELTINGTSQVVNSNVYYATGLTDLTAYNVSVRAICDVDDTSTALTGVFSTIGDCQTSLCNITIIMNDSYGDGWNGNAIEVYSGSTLLGSATLASGNYGEATIQACAGQALDFRWVSGSYASETSFDIINGDYSTILQNYSGSSCTGGQTITTATMSCASCIPISGLTVSNITNYSADLSWTAGGSETFWIIEVNGQYYDLASTNPYTLSNLNGGTIYTVGVRAYCSDNDTAVAVTTHFRTGCDNSACNVSVNINQEYDYASYNSGVAIWTVTNGVLDAIPLASSSEHGTFSTTVCDGDTVAFTYIAPQYSWATNTITIYDGGNTQVFSGTSTNMSADQVLYTMYEPCPSCIPPANLHLVYAGPDSLIVAWTEMGSATEYQVTINDSVVDPAYDTFYVFEYLAPNTNYTISVKAVCDASDTSAALSHAFKTACGTMTLPNFTDWENIPYNGAWPDCWTRLAWYNTDPSVNYVYNHTTGGQYSMYLQAYYGAYNMFASSAVPLAGDEIAVDFWLYLRSNSTANYVEAGVMSDLTDTSTFIPLLTITNRNDTWTEYEFNTSTLASDTTYYVAFRGYSEASYGAFGAIDDILISQLSECERPAYAVVDSLSYYTADLRWASVDGANSYSVYYGTENDFNSTNLLSITANDTAVTLQSLLPQTTYYAWVTTNCSGGDESDPRPVGNFTTEMTCASVQNIAIENITYTAAQIAWDYNTTVGFAPSGAQLTLTDNSTGTATVYYTTGNQYVFTGLTQGTSYTVAIRTMCQTDNNSVDTAAIATMTFMTSSCATIDSPNSSANVSWNPLNTYYGYSYTQNLYLASEMSPIDTIWGIAFHANGSTTNRPVDVYMGHTTQTTLSTSNPIMASNLTLVATNFSMPVQEGWNFITFDSFFVYDGTSNLVVAVDNNMNGWTSSVSWYTHPTSGTQSVGVYSDGTNYDPATITSFSYSNNNALDIQFVADCTPPACEAPFLTLGTVDSNSIVMNWVSVGSVNNFEVTISNGVQTADYGSTTANSYSFQNLQGNTLYTIAIGSICPGGNDTIWATMDVRTACGSMALPYSETFESNAVYDAPNCWNLVSTYNYSGNDWPLVYSNGYNSGHALRFIANGNTLATTAAIPNNGQQGDQYHIAFSARLGNYNVTATAGVMTDPTDITTYVGMVNIPTDNQWHRYNLYTVGMNAADIYRFAVNFNGSYSYNSDSYSLDIDDVLIELDGGCHYPENLVATYDSVSADLVWSVSGTQLNMLVGYTAAGGTETIVAADSDTSHHLTGLLPATTYTVRVGNLCANGDTLWGADSYVFTTECTVLNLPYSQNFDAYANDVMPPCWIWDVTYHTHWDGGCFFRNAAHENNPVVLPRFSSPVSKCQVDFDGKIGPVSEGSRFLIGVTDDNGNNLQWVDTLVDANQSRSNHVPFTYRFNNYTGPGTRIAVGYLHTYNDWALIDNVVVTLIPDCLPVDSLTAHNLEDPDSVWFTWTLAPDSYVSQWQVYVDTVTVDTLSIPAASLITVSSPHYLVPAGLMQGGGKYNFYVRSNCGTSVSPWTILEVGAGQVIMPQSGTDTVHACGSVVYDNGGPIAGYISGASSRLVMYPDDVNSRLQIYGAFLSFYNDGSTTMTIYDGVGNGGTVLYQTSYSGPTTRYDSIVSLPLATSSTGPLTIDFSAGTYVNPGFELYVRCIPIVICDQPTYVTATPMGYDSCALAWYGNSQSYDVYYRPFGTTNWTMVTVSSESCMLTGLTGSTTYEVQIQGQCSAIDFSAMSAIYTFTTGCDAVYITAVSPMVEEFEGTQAPPVCWNVVYGATANATDNPVIHDSTAAYSGAKGFRFSSENTTLTGNYRQTLITPRIVGDSAMTMQFYVRASSGVENFKVGYSVSGTDLATNFNWQPVVALNASFGWMHYTVNLPATTRYVAIDYLPSDHGYHLYVDSLVIAIADGSLPCEAPIVTSTSATDTSITLNYIAMNNVEAGIVVGSTWDNTVSTVNLPMSGVYTFTHLFDNTPLQDGTTYTIGLRTVCSDNEYSPWELVTIATISNDCDVPTNVTVSQIGSVSAVVSWNGGTAQEWEVYYTNGVNPGTITTTTTTATLTGLDRHSNYSVTVRAICGDSYSNWSEPATFQSIGCITPTGLNAHADTTNAILTWNSSDASLWELTWGLYGLTGDTHSVQVSGEPTYTLTGLQPGATYTYQVRALCTDEEISEWSDMFHFGTDDISGIEGVDNVNVAIFPNPATSETNISLSGFAGNVTIAIIDLSGRTVRTDSLSCNGDCSTTITVSDLSAGAYFVRINGEGINQVKKLLVK